MIENNQQTVAPGKAPKSGLVILALLVIILAFMPAITRPINEALNGVPQMRVLAQPRPLPNIGFKDERGEMRSLSEFRGRHVLINVWATWCPPCREEMPSLDALQDRMSGHPGFKVLAVSVDKGSPEQVRSFLSEIGVRNLEANQADETETLASLAIPGLPTTILVDHDGYKIARLSGPTRWDHPSLVKQIEGLIGDGPAGTSTGMLPGAH
jgi:thiol-disulfide isomerase/thioredoxin